jgi:DNA-binding response OmpR family regulator
MNILVVDDNPLVLHVMSAFFRRKGHTVMTYDAPLACPLYTAPACPCSPDAVCPDIIISDVDMPNVDGVSFVEAVFNKRCKCKHIALLSGKDLSDQNRKRASTMGTRFFTKPLDFDEFETWVMFRERAHNCPLLPPVSPYLTTRTREGSLTNLPRARSPDAPPS